MVCTVLFSLLFAAAGVFCDQGSGPRALTENGPVYGKYEISASGKLYRAFKGIPYAKPPIDDKRFKEPERLKSEWIGEWNAQEYGRPCLQLDYYSRTYTRDEISFQVVGSEDCLFLNVFTQQSGPPNKTVIFMIHGGAFMYGNGGAYGPEFIMDRDDVVFVTFNYRLGPMGFLTTGDNIVPGNSGLKDQAAALAWVNRNIANFGGDPRKVSIAGLSAGGASVDYMYLSPQTEGLFNRGYSFSGSAMCSWALVSDGVEKTKQLASLMGCPTTDSRTLVKCLRRRPAEQIVGKIRSFQTWQYQPFAVFGPVVEVDSTNPYIDDHPKNVIINGRSKDLPWVVGLTSEEGLYPAADFVTNEVFMNQLNRDWKNIGPKLLYIDPNFSEEAKSMIAETAKNYYMGNADITLSSRDDLIRLLSERLFNQGVLETAKLRATVNKSPVYMYLYGYQAKSSLAHLSTDSREPIGSCHGDDIMHLVKIEGINYNFDDQDKKMTNILKELFFSFEIDGKVPVKYNWPPVAKGDHAPKYLHIKTPSDIKISTEPLAELSFWTTLFNESVKKDEL